MVAREKLAGEEDLRVRVRRWRRPLLNILVVDASGSMSAPLKLATARAVLEKLVKECYVSRARLAIIVFQGVEAKVLQEPTRAPPEGLPDKLLNVNIGGSTPLPAALYKAYLMARFFSRKFPRALVNIHLVTDCKANVPLFKNVREDIEELTRRLVEAGVKLHIYPVRASSSINVTRDYCRVMEELSGVVHELGKIRG